MMGRLSWPQDKSPAPECAVYMFISQRFPGCHEAWYFAGSESGLGPLLAAVVYRVEQLFLQEPDYFYILYVAQEATERELRKKAVQEKTRRRNGNPGREFQFNSV